MSVFPPGELKIIYELAMWEVPKNLVGVVVLNIDELKERFPEDNGYNQVELETRVKREFPIYIRTVKGLEDDLGGRPKVAYGCKICGIIIGPPAMNFYDDIGFLSGSAGIQSRCIKCNLSLEKEAGVQS